MILFGSFIELASSTLQRQFLKINHDCSVIFAQVRTDCNIFSGLQTIHPTMSPSDFISYDMQEFSLQKCTSCFLFYPPQNCFFCHHIIINVSEYHIYLTIYCQLTNLDSLLSFRHKLGAGNQKRMTLAFRDYALAEGNR